MDISTLLKNTVSISQFNKGQARKIFEEVKETGVKIVFKNNEPECVLISPDQFMNLMAEIEDSIDCAKAVERIENHNNNERRTYSMSEVNSKLGIDEADLEGFDEVEFE